MKANNRIIYSIDIEDIQNLAEQELVRELTNKEIPFIEQRLGDYFDWYGAIASAINELT
jgi:hypothetical protein